MAGKDTAECFDIVKRPFRFDEIEIMPQTVKKETFESQGKLYSEAKVTPYFDARAVMDRLDEAFGPQNWRPEYREVHLKGGEVGMMCRHPLITSLKIGIHNGSHPSRKRQLRRAPSQRLNKGRLEIRA